MPNFFLLTLLLSLSLPALAQEKEVREDSSENLFGGMQLTSRFKPLFGTASYYADKFNGRQTANGDIYSHQKMTAACNKLPLNTWIRVTNLRNKRVVIVRVNDRLHPKNPRVLDLSRMAAEKLGYIGRGLTQVKVEVLRPRAGVKKPQSGE